MRLLKLVPDDTNLPFVSLRKWAFGLTAALTLIAVALVGVRGLNLGVDFVGGLMIEAKFPGAAPLDTVRGTVDSLGVGEAQLQQFGTPDIVSIRLPLPNSSDEGANNRVVNTVKTALQKATPGVVFTRYDTVSGKVSGELIRNGVIAVLLAIGGIALFAWFRFEWQFGVSTAVAIIHDVLMTLGFFALTRLEFDLNIVAAVLTIIGYSINDKIVIDDRIRENMRKYRKMELGQIIDLSVNETLPRTVMTSLTILLALVALLLFGGQVLRGFTAAMILGIVVGTYSSIYVSSSLLISLKLPTNPIEPAPTGKMGERRTRDAREAVSADAGTGPRLTRDPGAAGPIVQGFARGGFQIDGTVYAGALLTPEWVRAWEMPAALDIAALGDLLALAPLPEFILLGTGATLVRPAPALAAALDARGIGIEPMDSRAAARAWGVLRGEGRWIAAALMPL